MKKYLSKLAAFSKIKKIILSVLLLMIFSILILYVISVYRLKETNTLMRAMGVLSSETHMLYCEEKFESLAIIKVVVDFDDRTIMAYGRYHSIAVNPKTNMLYTVVGDVSALLTKGYVNQEGIPSLIIFTFDKASGKYSIVSMNAITDETQWRHDVSCKY